MSPTGYTESVQDGKVTEFPEFAMRCARAFGALVLMRDDPMDAPIKDFEPSTYNRDALKQAEARLVELRAMSAEEIATTVRAEYEAAVRDREEYKRRRDLHRRRYEAMLAKVREWTPPTPEHHGLKDFMVKQLTESIDFDCGGDWLPSLPTLDPDEWYGEQIRKAERDIAYHTAEDRKERERTDGRNRWVRELRESLARAGTPGETPR